MSNTTEEPGNAPIGGTEDFSKQLLSKKERPSMPALNELAAAAASVVEKKEEPARIVSPTRSKIGLMRHVSALGMEDPVFKTIDEQFVPDPAANIFEDMSLGDIPLEMRDMVSVVSDPTAVTGDGFDAEEFAKLNNSFQHTKTPISSCHAPNSLGDDTPLSSSDIKTEKLVSPNQSLRELLKLVKQDSKKILPESIPSTSTVRRKQSIQLNSPQRSPQRKSPVKQQNVPKTLKKPTNDLSGSCATLPSLDLLDVFVYDKSKEDPLSLGKANEPSKSSMRNKSLAKPLADSIKAQNGSMPSLSSLDLQDKTSNDNNTNDDPLSLGKVNGLSSPGKSRRFSKIASMRNIRVLPGKKRPKTPKKERPGMKERTKSWMKERSKSVPRLRFGGGGQKERDTSGKKERAASIKRERAVSVNKERDNGTKRDFKNPMPFFESLRSNRELLMGCEVLSESQRALPTMGNIFPGSNRRNIMPPMNVPDATSESFVGTEMLKEKPVDAGGTESDSEEKVPAPAIPEKKTVKTGARLETQTLTSAEGIDTSETKQESEPKSSVKDVFTAKTKESSPESPLQNNFLSETPEPGFDSAESDSTKESEPPSTGSSLTSKTKECTESTFTLDEQDVYTSMDESNAGSKIYGKWMEGKKDVQNSTSDDEALSPEKKPAKKPRWKRLKRTYEGPQVLLEI